MEALLLHPNWPASFRRCVRDESGKVLRTITFRHGEPQLLDGEDAAAVQSDIGKALVYAATDAAGNPVSKPATKPTIVDESIPRRRINRKQK
jgi:hypothetical protein